MASMSSPLALTVGAELVSTAVIMSTSLFERAVTRAADSGMMRKTTVGVLGTLSLSQ
jgi:hypothetical protein